MRLKNEPALYLHEHMSCVGWIAGNEAHALAYWTMRLADEIEGVDRYDSAYRTLRRLAWDHVRPFSNSQNAVSVQYAGEIQAFMDRSQTRFPAKYDQALREIRKALIDIRDVPADTGRVPKHPAAIAA